MTSLPLAGVLGDPVSHSLSPRLHTRWLRENDIEGEYRALHVTPEALEETFRRLPDQGFKGWNLTVPHKEAACNLVDEMDEAARVIGAVNTVVVNNNRLIGSNTDAIGFSENLHAHAKKIDTSHALVLGAGGAARAVTYALKQMNFQSITVSNRTAERAEELASHFCADLCAWNEIPKRLKSTSLLVNTTTLGMQGQPPLLLDLSSLPPEALVTDIVYNPLMTPLLTEAKKRGNPTVTGIGMLIHQAVPGFRAWFGANPEVTPELEEWLVA